MDSKETPPERIARVKKFVQHLVFVETKLFKGLDEALTAEDDGETCGILFDALNESFDRKVTLDKMEERLLELSKEADRWKHLFS
jgi:hypothetical protein